MEIWDETASNLGSDASLERSCGPRNSATTPETWEHAMEVPENVVSAWSEVAPADTMALPGAKISTHLPKLLNEDLLSSLVVDPTVTGDVTQTGPKLHVCCTPPFAAATTTVIPLLTAALIASATDATFTWPARLALIKAGLWPLANTQSMA